MKKTITIFVILLQLLFSSKISFGQTNCSTAQQVCLNDTTIYPMSVSTMSESGPNYGCLHTYPNPAWYYIKISNPGVINIQIEGNDGSVTRDVDFICWGPFNSLNSVCTDSLIGACAWGSCPNNTSYPSFYPAGGSPNIIDCSYDAAPIENCHILNGQTGQYYMLCITNFSNQPGIITFTQTSGTGSSDCSFLNIPEESTNINSLSIFPNPNEGLFTISFKAEIKSNYKIEITNSLGQQVYNETINKFVGDYSKKINLVDFGKGVYTISLLNNDNIITKKIVVN
jgi:hypothetical protein